MAIALNLLSSQLESSAQNPAETARTPKTGREPDQRDWAFKPIANPAVPEVKQAGLVLTPVDAFILALE